MEHEVVVPLPISTVREALEDRDLIGRHLPGFSIYPDGHSAEETAGRLRVRIGGSTITYGGYLSIRSWQEDGVLTVFLTGEELRGDGDADAQVHISLAETPEGTVLHCRGELNAKGRLAGFDRPVLLTVGRRMIDRTVAGLVAELTSEEGQDDDEITATIVYLEDRSIEQELDDDLSDLIAFSDDDPLPAPELAYDAEAALADGPVRRSIVGRSAEEVDHAPPRGRYAPMPPAHSARARAASRWGGVEPTLLPGARGERSAIPWMIGGGVVLIGGAVVLVRVLRRK